MQVTTAKEDNAFLATYLEGIKTRYRLYGMRDGRSGSTQYGVLWTKEDGSCVNLFPGRTLSKSAAVKVVGERLARKVEEGKEWRA